VNKVKVFVNSCHLGEEIRLDHGGFQGTFAFRRASNGCFSNKLLSGNET